MTKIIAIVFLFIFVVTGCVSQNSKKHVESKNISTKGGNLLTKHRPDFKRPAKKSNIYGLVKNVVGNEVIVLKIDRPEKMGDKNRSKGNTNDNKASREQKDPSDRLRIPGMSKRTWKGKISDKTIDVDQRLKMLKSISTGEEKIMIPVGIKMLKNEDGKIVEATLTDITMDKILLVWTDETITDRNVANFVIIN